jgi:hypothetical protein
MAEKTDRVAFRLAPETKEALAAAAKADDRSLSALADQILRDWLRKRGWLKAARK